MGKILLIDTSSSFQTIVSLKIENCQYFLKEKTDNLKSQNLLPLIDKLLKKYKTKPQDLTGIELVTGPGSFTGLRVGAAIANTLGWVLNIPVNKKKLEMELKYE